MLQQWVAGKPELFASEPEIDAYGDRVLVALPAPDVGGIFTVAWFDDGLIVRMEDFSSRRKAEKVLRSNGRGA